MDNTQRSYPRLSACGLNCGLCPRYHTDGDSRCPGCGGKDFLSKRPSCGILSCCRRHGGIEYCFLCPEYPCKKYDGVHLVDSFITHRHMLKDFEKAKKIGLEAYRAELDEKVDILQKLLAGYNDGRRKSFYCLAVNLLELEDVKAVMAQAENDIPKDAPEKEKVAQAVQLFSQMAEKRGIALELNKKRREK